MLMPPGSPEPIKAVYLVTGEPEPVGTAPSGPDAVAAAGIAVAAAILLAIATIAALRRRRRVHDAMDPADLALLALSRRLRLRRSERATLRDLASAPVADWPGDVHPVALLVSRQAFETAAAVACSRQPEQAPAMEAIVVRIRRKAFGRSPT
jgi:hypothetical protein